MSKKHKNAPIKRQDSSYDVTQDLKDRALAAAAEGITISDAKIPNQPIIYVNQGFERLTGYLAEEVIGLNCRFLQGDETDAETIQHISEALERDQTCSVEILNHRKDGTPFWNRLSITPVKNESGITTHFIGIQSDITKRKNTEEALEKTNSRLEEANQNMKNGLEAAARIQQSLLPRSTPDVAGYNFSWFFKPCDELAGDTLNIIPLNEKIVALYSLDVSGHGVPSALLSATLSHWLSPKPDQDTILETEAEKTSRLPVQPEKIGKKLNRLFPMDLDHPQYFTLGYGLLDTATDELTYLSAGHPPAIQLGINGDLRLLETGGPPVGILQGSSFKQCTTLMKPGDRIFIYTDGLTEAVNHSEIEFGMDRLCRSVKESAGLPLDDAIKEIIKAHDKWTEGNNPADDISIIAFEKTK